MAEERGLPQWIAQHWRVIFTVCGALIAAILGAAVQEVLDTRLRLAAATALVVCLLAVTLLAGLSALVDSRLKADRDIVATVRGEVARHQALADGTAGRISALGYEMGTLAKSVGLKIDTMLINELNNAQTIESDRTLQLILQAREEIRILDLLPEDGHWPEESMNQSYLTNAFDAFRELLEHSNPPIAYKRIIQVREPRSSLRRASTASLVKHCHELLELQRAKGCRVSLRVTRQRFPFKFIVIDRSAIVLQLHEYGGHAGGLRVWGEVLIGDPSGHLVAVFHEIWDELIDDPSTRTVTVADLPRPRGAGGEPPEPC